MKDIFKDCVISCCGTFSVPQSEIYKLISANGGKTEKSFSSRCTHLITTTTNYNKKTNNVKKALATIDSSHLVSEDFIHKSIELGKRVKESLYTINIKVNDRDTKEEEEEEEVKDEEKVKKSNKLSSSSKKAESNKVKKEKKDEEEEEKEEVEGKGKSSKRKREVEVEEKNVKEEVDDKDEEVQEEDDKPKKQEKKKSKTKEIVRFQPVDDSESLLKMTDIVAMYKAQKMIFYNCAQQQLNTQFNSLFELLKKSLVGSVGGLAKDELFQHSLDEVFHPVLLRTLTAKLNVYESEQKKQKKDDSSNTVQPFQYLNQERIESILGELLTKQKVKSTPKEMNRLIGVTGLFINDMLERVTEHRARHKQKWTSHTNIRHIISESVTLSLMFPELDTYCKPTGPRAKGRPKKVYFGDENNHI
ncbi:hypothetical protein PPL_04940 [Heterostelium album PN500]|uniref:BRCT domain-containing protein n=1 Tax=Heterostelium pallidum (strain ATCC 26659 / Pp 5 / PN500) TaxID=670386 RepID=D3B8Z6_HETP5|nr:hypothetical protein PPL_04940 [Heterostelium album PN500]EFA82035.1 hypothetical protein PPL_04940 [Heterostelium album PN500]|eukprot:XP_020434152.1 hypothetical protein PPL_04940 [Heterostelium album PN500]